MPTIVSQLDRAFRSAIVAAFGFDADPLIGVAQNDKFGDYQSNAAMGLAKQLAERAGQKANPRAVAEQVKAKLDLGAMASEVTIAGPGFINVRLAPAWVSAQLARAAADATGRLDIAKTVTPQTVVVDYSGPNIAKQMHVGHLRSTIIGDAVARTLDFSGDHVIRQNHLGDWGTQFGRVVLAMWYEAVFERTGNRHVLDELLARQQAASRERNAAALGAVVRDLHAWHQRFIDEDPDGDLYFEPYLRDNRLDLDELERAYQFVSAVTDTPEAGQLPIVHRTHGPQPLGQIPRLTTTFIQDLRQDHKRNQQERMAWEKARTITLDTCQAIYQRLNVQLGDPTVQSEPLERGESFYAPYLPEVVAELRAKGLAVESEGATVVPIPGHDNPLIIQKKPLAGEEVGEYLYGTTDLAAIRYRVTGLGATRIVYFVDARQSQHFQQVFWTARAAGWAPADGDAAVALEHAPFGTMLGPDGKPIKTREGDSVKLKDLLVEAQDRAGAVVLEKNPTLPLSTRDQIAHAVGVGAVKYADLSKDRTSDYVFAWERMLTFDGNTAPYLQNAYVRVHGIFRKAATLGVDTKSLDHSSIRLETPQELSLAKHMLRLGEVIELVKRELKPHHLCTYLFELANRFHVFFEHCPVLQSEEPVRGSRLALCDLTAKTLGLGLDLLGIEHPEQM